MHAHSQDPYEITKKGWNIHLNVMIEGCQKNQHGSAAFVNKFKSDTLNMAAKAISKTISNTEVRHNRPNFISVCERYSLRKQKIHFSNWLKPKFGYQKTRYQT